VPQSIVQSVAENIPGARQQLPAAVDVLGRPVANPLQGLGELLPARAAAGQASPVLQAYQNAGVAPTAAPSSIPYGPTNEIRLTPAEQQAFERYRGDIIQQAAGDMVTSPEWQDLGSTPEGRTAQQQVLTRIDDNAQQVAQRMVLGDIASGPGAGLGRTTPTGRLAPVIPYSPNVLANQQLLLQEYQRQAQHAALMQSLLAG
jgi:hypothetical protein